jgi:hypothetical protein
MRELRLEVDYLELPPRAHVGIFSSGMGDRLLATLLQLARVGRLDGELAHKILKTPGLLKSLIEKIEEKNKN